MGILNIASAITVSRGYNYCKEGKVIQHIKLSDDEYEGYVEGTNKEPYKVKIDINHPKSSFCECPFANGKKICKHMVALFFTVLPDELSDYEGWLKNDYEDDDYEDTYYDGYYEDEYYEDEYYKDDFVIPIFFDEILSNFVNDLSKEKLKDILMSELKRDKEYTFKTYLQKEFKKHITDENNIHGMLDKINSNFYKLGNDYDYNNRDYTVKLLTKNEKEKISDTYLQSKTMKSTIDKIILNPEIATYNDYKWIAVFYKNNNTKKDIKLYIDKLESFFDILKHHSVIKTIPKSNILISIHLLNGYGIKKTAELLVKNCKYVEYVAYIIENAQDIKELYKWFNRTAEKQDNLNEEYISRIYYSFYLHLMEKDIYNQYVYHSFLHNKDVRNLMYLKETTRFDYYISKMLKEVKDIITLEKIYLFLDRKDELFNLLCNKANEHRLIYNIDILKDKYNSELLKYFEKRFFEVVAKEKSRGNYKKAVIYIGAMKKISKECVNKLIDKLKKSEYANRRALFDEITNIL